MHQHPNLNRRVAANNGDPFTALRCAARWCVAVERNAGDVFEAPALAPVRCALVNALANTSRPTLDALAAALTRWCERASSDAYDHTSLAPLVLSAVDAAGLCTSAESPDGPVAGDPPGP